MATRDEERGALKTFLVISFSASRRVPSDSDGLLGSVSRTVFYITGEDREAVGRKRQAGSQQRSK